MEPSIEFTKVAYKDYLWWRDHDAKKFERINELLRAIVQKPFTGIGKPEPLKHDLQGYWSRRINSEHRLVYTVQKGTVFVVSCRYHY